MECALQNLRAQCVEPLIEGRRSAAHSKTQARGKHVQQYPHFGVRRCCTAFDLRGAAM